MTKTFESVKQDYMDRRGIKSMHLNLGPEATPELLEKELYSLEALDAEYNTLSEAEKWKAKHHFLEERMKKIAQFGKASIQAWDAMSESERHVRQEIFKLCELRSAINMREHIDFIKGTKR